MTPSRVARTGHRGWKWLGGLLGTLLALEVLLHLALNLGAVRAFVERGGPATRVDWKMAWAPWPSRVHLRGFSVEHRDPHDVWRIEADTVEAELSLSALFQRRVETKSLRAQGVRARVRPATDEEAAPPRPGHRPWSIELRGVKLRALRELAWHDVRYEGTGEAEGMLSLIAGQDVVLRLEKLRLPDGTLRLGEDMLARLDSLSADFTLEAHRGAGELALLEGTSGRLQARLSLPSLQELAGRSAHASGLKLHGGEGRLDVDLRLRDGKLLPGSQVKGQGETLTVSAGPLKVTTPWRIEGDVVARDGAPSRGEFRFRFEPVRIDGHEPRLLELPEVSFTVDVEPREPPTRWDLQLHLHETRSKPMDLSRLNAWTAPTFRIDSGSARLKLEARLGPGITHRGVHLSVETDLLSMRWNSARLIAGASLVADGHRLALHDKGLVLDGMRLNIHHLSSDQPGASVRKWEGTLDFPKARLTFSPHALEGHFTATASDASPLAAMMTTRGKLPHELSKLVRIQGLKASGQVALGPSGARVSDLRVHAPDLEVEGRLDSAGGATHAVLLVTLMGAALGVEVTPAGTHVHVKDARSWYTQALGRE